MGFLTPEKAVLFYIPSESILGQKITSCGSDKSVAASMIRSPLRIRPKRLYATYALMQVMSTCCLNCSPARKPNCRTMHKRTRGLISVGLAVSEDLRMGKSFQTGG